MFPTRKNASGHTPHDGCDEKANEKANEKLTENQDLVSPAAIVDKANNQDWYKCWTDWQSDDEFLKTLQDPRGCKIHKRHSEDDDYNLFSII